jgi:prepilin-type N-terminal cleavage/methylation domain-containing protein
MAMRQQQSGFTLIEIAIVLVIIGLLLGGVLKGQELITQAKIKNVANDFNGLTAAMYGYQDRYKALPGDDPNAVTGRWTQTNAIAAVAPQVFGNNKIEGTYNATTGETALFWQELRLAGFITGDLTSAAQPLNAAGGITGVQTGTPTELTNATGGLIGPLICATSLPGKIAQAIDSQFDDGKPDSGSVRAMTDTAPPNTSITGAAATSYKDDGSTLYVVCKTI